MAVTTRLHAVASTDVRRAAGTPGALSSRLPALAGVVFFALIMASTGLRSGAPSATDSGGEIFDYVAAHQGRLQLGAVLMGFAMAAALTWLAGLFPALRRAEGGNAALAVTALAGGILAAASTATTALLQGTLALRIAELGPTGVPVWWTLYLLSTGATLLGLLVLLGGSALVSLHAGMFSRWSTVATALLALASLVGAATVGYDSAGIQAVAGIAILGDSVWILVVSLFLWRHPEKAVG